jgi:hypothetical protein
MRTIRAMLTFPGMLQINSRSTIHFTLGLVGVTISPTDWVVMGRVAVSFTGVGRDASSKVSLLDSLATHQTFIVVCDSISSADWDECLGLGTAAVAEHSSFWKSLGGSGEGEDHCW